LKHLQPSSSDPEKDSFSSGRLLRRHVQRPYAAAPWPTIPAPHTVVLVGQKKAVAIAVRNVSGRRRWSKLDEWLAGRKQR